MWFSFLLLLSVFEEGSLAKTTSGHYCNLSCIDDGGNLHYNVGCDVASCAPRMSLCLEIKTNMSDFREAMLKLHNTRRNEWAQGGNDSLQPIANMNVLNWDEDLEFLAKCWANTCRFSLNYCRKTPKFFNAGMNYAFTKRTIVEDELKSNHYPYWEYAFNDNWNSIQAADIGSDREKSYDVDEGFYVNHSMSVQVIWGATTHIGCARSEFKGPYSVLAFEIVCLYGPQGNRAGRKMFSRGPAPCSACKTNVTCGKKYPNLCGDEEPIVLSESAEKKLNFALVFVALFCRNILYD